MSEHPFGDDLIRPLNDDSATERASELAERLLDEIARADHSWATIETSARALAQLAGAMARGG